MAGSAERRRTRNPATTDRDYWIPGSRPSAFGQSLPSGAPKARPGGPRPGMTAHMIRISKSLYSRFPNEQFFQHAVPFDFQELFELGDVILRKLSPSCRAPEDVGETLRVRGGTTPVRRLSELYSGGDCVAGHRAGVCRLRRLPRHCWNASVCRNRRGAMVPTRGRCYTVSGRGGWRPPSRQWASSGPSLCSALLQSCRGRKSTMRRLGLP